MLNLILHQFASAFRSRRSLWLENIALRHPLEVLRRNKKRPSLRDRDRRLWVILRKIWPDWRRSLCIVRPETVIRGHKRGFRAYWRRMSRSKRRGRPRLSREERDLIRKMAKDNPTWGAPRIHGEWLKLGIEIGPTTVAKYMARTGPPPQRWQTFLNNHAADIVSADFFTVPTIGYRVLNVFLRVHNASRQIVHFNGTANPTADWTALQGLQAFPWDTAPTYRLRDRDGVYGKIFQAQLKAMGITELMSAPRSPWQNPSIERLIGTVRRECTDHVIVLNERPLSRILRGYVEYYPGERTHLGLAKECPVPRAVEPPEDGPIRKRPMVGGLHPRYFREAA